MKSLTFRSFLVFVLSMALSTGAAEAGFSAKNISSGINIMQPRKAKKAQKKQDAKEKKKKNAIKDGSKQAQKRSYEIQSPEVQARMKQNKKDTAARDKAQKKNNKSRTKKGAKKYR
jgi:preprotein translocase subunit SecF